METLDLAGGSRLPRLGEDVVDSVLAADAVKKDFDGGWATRPVKTLPLSVRTWAGTPYSRIAELNPSHTACVRSLSMS